jgi:2-oxo-4-hydroxy-4-carboxy--5-ureidoimidazoline (OHCU) decarboxylase
MVDKLTVDQMQRMEKIEQFQKVVEHSHHLVQELAANRAAPTKVLARICESIARDMSQMRQRALTSNIGTIADVAGALAVMAARGGGMSMKIRGLEDGVHSLRIQLEHALKMASTIEEKKDKAP